MKRWKPDNYRSTRQYHNNTEPALHKTWSGTFTSNRSESIVQGIWHSLLEQHPLHCKILHVGKGMFLSHGVYRAIVTPSSFSRRTVLNSAGTPEHAGDYHIHADITQDQPAPQSVGERRYTPPEEARGCQYHSCKGNGDVLERSHGRRSCETNRHSYMELKYKTCDSR